jgi:hypothetical protein
MNITEYIKSNWETRRFKNSPLVKICYLSREEFARILCVAEYKTGVEIGVMYGNFSECLCINNMNLYLTSIDPYSMIENNGNFDSQEIADSVYRKAYKKLSKYNCNLVRKTSIEASEDFFDASLDFVYIDGNHMYPKVFEDISVWYPKVRSGGMISGHDYMLRNSMCQVTEAVNDFVRQNKIAPLFIFGSHTSERIKSWMWVKP